MFRLPLKAFLCQTFNHIISAWNVYCYCCMQVAGAVCRACGSRSGTHDMLVCDGCSGMYHNGCLIHPLSESPRAEWRCPKCVAWVNVLSGLLWCCIQTIIFCVEGSWSVVIWFHFEISLKSCYDLQQHFSHLRTSSLGYMRDRRLKTMRLH